MRRYLTPSLCLAALSFDTRLLGLQNLLTDAAFVEQVQELLLLAVHLLESSGMAVRLALRNLHVALSVFPHRYTNRLLLVGGEADSCVVVHDGSLDASGLNVASSAGMFTSPLMTETPEVVIDTAFAADAVKDHPASAVPAVDRPPQIVLVLARAVAAEHCRFQYLLDFLEGGLVDDRLMASFGVLHAIPGHHAEVELVAEHPMNLGARQGSGRALRGLAGTQPGFLKEPG
ncbi:MAG TPA: hypothetical protein VIH71_15725 [Solirubrobacteraceae bacterium]